MDRFIAAIHRATGYVYLSHWTFNPQPLQLKACDSEEEARAHYAVLVQELPLQAAMAGTAVRAVLTDLATDSVLEADMYSGERVRFHYAAYQAGERRYVDQILADVSYYEAMQPSDGITTVAIASTIEELEYQLGGEFEAYERLT